MLVWGLPLAAFVVAAVLAATLLIPLGLLAVVLVAVLVTALPSRPPAELALVAAACVVAVATDVWAMISFATS